MKNRIISWFSCGAASAVATRLKVEQAKKENKELVIAYCEVKEEHPDNMRFLKDCESWFDKEITILGNDKYNRSIYEVFNKTRYLAGHAGARCTLELKKNVRKEFEQENDEQVFGYTAEETKRINNFVDANNYVDMSNPLAERGLIKQDCLAMIDSAGIEIPEMYKLGYKNNNCRGCVKAQSPAYWKKIKIDFPEYFDKMHEQEKRLNVSICKATIDGKPDVRMQLDSLPEWIEAKDDSIDIQCGIFCHMAEKEYMPARAG